MTDVAMHMMDIAQNSLRAGAGRIEIDIEEKIAERTLMLRVTDDGKGMDAEMVDKLSDPFYTTRTTRRVGLGIPLLRMTCEQAGGGLQVSSEVGKGSIVEAFYRTDHPDCLPLGDVAGYLALLLKANPEIHFRFSYRVDETVFVVDTDEWRQQGIDWQDAEMLAAVKEYIGENILMCQ